VQVSRIEEMLGPALPAKNLFREYSEAEFKEHEHWLAPNFYQPETGKLIASNHSWLLRTDRHVILIDSCSGNHKPRPEMARYDMLNTRYLDTLKTAGAQPEEIDFVLCTHLHVDHVGWDTQIDNGRWVPTFRNAKHIMSRLEHDFWCTKEQNHSTPCRL
jgi:glyoxylase-like metal-dependent hydrolase (beta-lactamase superfamily II)